MANNTTYRELADVVFSKIKDYSFCEMSEDIAYEIVIGYMQSAIVKFENCKQDLSDRDDVLQEFNFALSDQTMVILSNYMVLEWLDANYIKTSATLKARLSSSDFHALQLSNMLGKAMELHDMLKSENDQLAINLSYKNSKLFEIASRKKV